MKLLSDKQFIKLPIADRWGRASIDEVGRLIKDEKSIVVKSPRSTEQKSCAW